MCHKLICLFGGSIEGDGMVNIVMDRKGHLCVCAVNRTGRGKYKVFHLMVSAPFKDVKKPCDIAVYIGIWIDKAVSYTCLGSDINYYIKLLIFKEL